MKLTTFIATAIIFAGSASAHTIFQQLYVNGATLGHEVGIRVPTYDGPITDVTSNDLICNGGINPYQTPVSTTIIPVPAGASVTAEFHHTLAGYDPSDSADPIDPSHKGPVIAYLAQIPSAIQTSVTGLNWFKIYQDGLDGSSWAVDKLIANKGNVTFSIPSCIAPGQYLLRVEIIALHAASTYPGAQFYMECAQINISGGGSTSPATVSFPGAYQSTDPGITINIYETLTSYTIPGPPVFSCAAGSGPAPTTTAPVSSSKPPPTSTVVPTSSKPASSSTAPVTTSIPVTSGTQAHYAQCGGIGWTGGTVCVSPYTCTVSSAYYSQCL